MEETSKKRAVPGSHCETPPSEGSNLFRSIPPAERGRHGQNRRRTPTWLPASTIWRWAPQGSAARSPSPSLIRLLPRHSYSDSFLLRDKVIEALGRFAYGELHPLDFSVECIPSRAVVRGDRGAAVLPDIAAVVGGEDHRLRHGNGPLADLLAINIERHLAALAKTAASVGKLHAHLVLARRQRLLGFDEEVVHSRHVIAVFELAVFRVKAPPADVRALGDDHALGTRLWDLDLGGDGVGFVLDVQDAVLREASHTAEQYLRLSFNQHGAASGVRINLLGNPVVDGQHIVAGRLDQPESLQLVELLGHLLGEVVSLAPVLAGVVEFPDVVVKRYRLSADKHPGCGVLRH